LLQLLLGDVLAVQLLDLQPELGIGAHEVPLPFGDVELAVGLELGVAQHLLQDLRRRRAAGRLADLLVRHRDSQSAVGLLEQQVANQLLGDLVLHRLLVLARQPAAALLAAYLLERRLILLLEAL